MLAHADAARLVAAWEPRSLWLVGTGQVMPRFAVDRALAHGEAVDLGGRRWRIVWTPGHAVGGVAWWCEHDGLLITGDALWEDGFGLLNTWIDGPEVFDLAAVALDNARADYANDALDMGLLIAEELMNPTGGPSRLQTYASCIYYELARRPDDHRTALEDFMAKAVSDTPGDDPLLDRVRLELAGIYANEGRLVPAADLCGRVAREHPDGHRAAAALYRQGAYLIQAGREREGREVWERLLVQYPDALETDDTRERLRSLP